MVGAAAATATDAMLRKFQIAEFSDIRFTSHVGRPFDVTMATMNGNLPLRLWLRCVDTDTKWECTVHDTTLEATGKVFVWDSSHVINALHVALSQSKAMCPGATFVQLALVLLEQDSARMVLTIDPDSPLGSTYTFPLTRSVVAPMTLMQTAMDKLERENDVLRRAIAAPVRSVSVVATSKLKVPRDTFLTWSVLGWLDPAQFALTPLTDAVVLVQSGKYCVTVQGQFEHRHGHNAMVLFVNGMAAAAPPGSKAVDVMNITHVMDVPAHAYLRRAEQLERLASSSYLRAMEAVRQEDNKTRAALKLIADNHEQRAMRWHRTLTLNQSPHASSVPSHITIAATATPTTSSVPLDHLTSPTTVAPPPSTAPTTEDYNLPLQTAASEMEELFDRLKALGLGPLPSTRHSSQSHPSPGHHPSQPWMKQHLSSDLGDSFCLLPKASHGKGASSSSSLAAHRVDGGATLKAAAAHRMKNQREIQYDGGEAIHEAAIGIGGCFRRKLPCSVAKDTESMARLREENKRLVHAMDEFKTEYHQKARIYRIRHSLRELSSSESKLEADMQILRDELAAATDASRQKDVQLQRYETWFKSLKASAKAKQQSRDYSNAADKDDRNMSFDTMSQMPPPGAASSSSTRRDL
ncbi:hypothetical protein B5M09_002496 [Aphanomyces astaci]|uniref:Uncharacterized protein n=1 Tax=Aphanomyces astaci TaxID=112090 RepID=A0A3R7YH83_APHAT|nr:hypothetical protein B5M09_002496 [Aphanomyces astaci]